MKLASALLLAAAAANAAVLPDLIVYLHHGAETSAIFGPAEHQAQRMLAVAGVSIEWRLGAPNYRGPAEVIEISLRDRSPDDFKPGALAYSELGPRYGTRVVILFDRARSMCPAGLLPAVMAHVLVHEITHIIQGVDRHSSSGVMKAHWDPGDFRAMRDSLPFAAEDLDRIHVWLARHRRMAIAAR